eukprot:m.75247 g.75247  ORF g.75247 m.75247 type:complete len:428 (+) comp12491_c0_seq2:22-1305(+)
MADALSDRLQECRTKMFAKFDRLRKHGSTEDIPFWDVIVLTATDEAQADSYQKQLEIKQKAKEIPTARYHVFSDPPGPKIGNGGATMYALSKLEDIYGASLDEYKVLLIHAGGFSKRLPIVSVIGKIFAALPFGDPVYTMLETKLATYIDFPSKMKPGVFLTCADDIELLDPAGELDFTKGGFTALGHPSSLEIGTTHGVFVLDHPLISNEETPCQFAECARFLHKPSIATMKEQKAEIGDGMVLTDSAFFFDRATTKLLLEFYTQNNPILCEIDAYGDFLQALGPKSTHEYTGNNANVISETNTLSETRLKLYEHLKGTRLNVIACHISKFYHIGTVPEYLHHFTDDLDFERELGCGRKTVSAVAIPSGTSNIIHSVVKEKVELGNNTVIEFSEVESECHVGSQCLLSCVSLLVKCKKELYYYDYF